MCVAISLLFFVIKKTPKLSRSPSKSNMATWAFKNCLCVLTLGPEYEEVEVHLLREKTGFGFRILGGDEAVQAVSPDARDKARMGRAGPHT